MANDLGALVVDEVRQLAQPFGHLAPQGGGGAVGEILALGALLASHRFALGGELEQQRRHLGGLGGRLAVELYVADPVRVVERPKRRKQLRGLATCQLRHLPTPFPLQHGSAPCALESTNPGRLSANPVRLKVPKGTGKCNSNKSEHLLAWKATKSRRTAPSKRGQNGLPPRVSRRELAAMFRFPHILWRWLLKRPIARSPLSSGPMTSASSPIPGSRSTASTTRATSPPGSRSASASPANPRSRVASTMGCTATGS